MSTLGGREVWFDRDVLRLNYEGRGVYLGEFQGDDTVLVVLDSGEYFTTSYDASNHYPDNILILEKFRPKHVWTAILNDADQGYPYIKRFAFEPSQKRQRYLGENENSSLIALSDKPGAMFKVTFGAPDDFREPLVVDAEAFIAVKSFKAKGKRLTTFAIASVEELEPKEVAPDDAEDVVAAETETFDEREDADETRSDDEVRDEINGQQRIF